MIDRKWHAIIALALAAATAPAPARAANFLEFLFGRQTRPQVYAAYPPPQAYPQSRPVRIDPASAAREEAARRARDQARQAAAAEARKREMERNAEFLKALGELQRANPGSLQVFANDPTLRKGDIVATRNGFSVYRGGRSAPRASDFVPIAAVKNLPNRNLLLALQQSSYIGQPVVRRATAAQEAEEPRPLTIRAREKKPSVKAEAGAPSTAAVRVIPTRIR